MFVLTGVKYDHNSLREDYGSITGDCYIIGIHNGKSITTARGFCWDYGNKGIDEISVTFNYYDIFNQKDYDTIAKALLPKLKKDIGGIKEEVEKNITSHKIKTI